MRSKVEEISFLIIKQLYTFEKHNSFKR